MGPLRIPLHTVGEKNQREHWSKKAKRVRAQRNATFVVLINHVRAAPFVRRVPIASQTFRPVGVELLCPITVTLTRISPPRNQLRDDDSVVGSLAACRDGVADALGINDSDKRVTWVYRQEKGDAFAVLISIEQAQPLPTG